jgi:hypothetical protein
MNNHSSSFVDIAPGLSRYASFLKSLDAHSGQTL